MANPARMKLGKRAPRHDIRTLQMADYLRTTALPNVPPTQDWGGKVTGWTMMANAAPVPPPATSRKSGPST